MNRLRFRYGDDGDLLWQSENDSSERTRLELALQEKTRQVKLLESLLEDLQERFHNLQYKLNEIKRPIPEGRPAKEKETP